MDFYYVFVLSSRGHRHLSVGATASLAMGVAAHRARIARRLGKDRVYQKLVYVESLRGVAAAVDRQRELSRLQAGDLRGVVASINPTFEPLSLRRLGDAGYDQGLVEGS